MSYLRLIRHKMQDWAETMAAALNIEIAIADKNLSRIVGTGNFYEKINEYCPEDSIFAKVLDSGSPRINFSKGKDCLNCSSFNDCPEFANISYPIIIENETLGVISFSAFDEDQTAGMRVKKEEYINMIKHMISIIEKEISSIKITNQLKRDITDVNEIINCLNKGIILINHEERITHINIEALKMLKINLSDKRIIGKKIKTFIEKIKLNDTAGNDVVDCWKINSKDVRVIYSINKISLENRKDSLMISFDGINDIINIAKTYENKNKISFSNIIGNSQVMLEVINKAKIAANTDSTILIQGESGTGKDLLAQSIHNESLRREGPFIALNCASIPENLMESELFGYEKGAFTGANASGKKGKIELAHNGTLFLDEIGDLPLAMQTKLLRVIQERTIDKVGGSNSIDVNIRIISATNKDLMALVEEGEFRLDLFYRLHVIPIELPALREREEDVFLCGYHIIEKLCKKMNKRKARLSQEVKEAFQHYTWPGNIRELENILEHGICFSQGEYITLQDLPPYFLKSLKGGQEKVKTSFPKDNILPSNNNKSLEELKEDFEEFIIREMIDLYGDSVEGKKKVAEKLNIGLTTLYRKLNKY